MQNEATRIAQGVTVRRAWLVTLTLQVRRTSGMKDIAYSGEASFCAEWFPLR